MYTYCICILIQDCMYILILFIYADTLHTYCMCIQTRPYSRRIKFLTPYTHLHSASAPRRSWPSAVRRFRLRSRDWSFSHKIPMLRSNTTAPCGPILLSRSPRHVRYLQVCVGCEKVWCILLYIYIMTPFTPAQEKIRDAGSDGLEVGVVTHGLAFLDY